MSFKAVLSIIASAKLCRAKISQFIATAMNSIVTALSFNAAGMSFSMCSKKIQSVSVDSVDLHCTIWASAATRQSRDLNHRGAIWVSRHAQNSTQNFGKNDHQPISFGHAICSVGGVKNQRRSESDCSRLVPSQTIVLIVDQLQISFPICQLIGSYVNWI